MAYQHTFKRHKTREVRVGDKAVGGENPIWVQSNEKKPPRAP